MPVTIRGSGQLIVQIAQTVKSDNFTSTTKGSYVAVTGLSVTITPSSASNRMLISANVTTGNLNNLACFFHIYRNGSQITPNGVNTGQTPNSTFSALGGGVASNTGVSTTLPLEFLDSPATTSPVTYQIFAAVGSGSSQNLNVNPATQNGGGTAGGSSTITVMEISG
jgi:hypothetical protein